MNPLERKRNRCPLLYLLLGGMCFGLGGWTSAEAASRPDWRTLLRHPLPWYASDEARRLGENILHHQTPLGDWPKNTDTTAAPAAGARPPSRGTFDNGATVNEIRFLARVVAIGEMPDPEIRRAVERGLNHIFAAQYPNGGWPQRFPPGQGYERHITFNDRTQVNLMELMRDLSRSPEFVWLEEAFRHRAALAFQKGVEVIVRSQIRVNGTLTVWCAQHDEITLEPRPARSYELASLSGSESADLLLLLMRLEAPTEEVRTAIQAGVDWFTRSRIDGIRVVTRDGDRRVEADPSGPPLWARFYDLKTGRPIFVGRDGVPKDRMADIEAERRNGYAWYGNGGERVAREYQRWKQHHSR
jgi:PelA/Pel-15E family pectate lyase